MGRWGQKWDLVVTFDWRVLLTLLKCILQDLFRKTPLDHIWRAQIRAKIMPNMAKYAYLGAYLGAPYMVKWGVPEKILQNAVQTHWSLVNRTLKSKVMTKSNFRRFPHCNYNVKLKSGGYSCFMGL